MPVMGDDDGRLFTFFMTLAMVKVYPIRDAEQHLVLIACYEPFGKFRYRPWLVALWSEVCP